MKKITLCYFLGMLILFMTACQSSPGLSTPTPAYSETASPLPVFTVTPGISPSATPSPSPILPPTPSPVYTPTAVKAGSPFDFSYISGWPDEMINEAFTDIWQEKCHIQIIQASYILDEATYFTYLESHVASGTLPDMVGQAKGQETAMQIWAESGNYFLNIEAYLQEYAPFYVAQLKNFPDRQKNLISDNGKIYRIGGFEEKPLGEALWLNMGLVRQLGMTYHENWTTGDMLSFFQAMHIADEEAVPFGICSDKTLLDSLNGLFGGGYEDDTDNLHPFLQDKMLHLLTDGNNLYQQNFLKICSKEALETAVDQNRVGLYWGDAKNTENLTSGTNGVDFMPILPLVHAETGRRGVYPQSSQSDIGSYYINRNASHPAYIIKAMNWLLTEEAAGFFHEKSEPYENLSEAMEENNGYAPLCPALHFTGEEYLILQNTVGGISLDDFITGERELHDLEIMNKEQVRVVYEQALLRYQHRGLLYT